MTPPDCLNHAIRPACAMLGMADPRADVLLLAIALQESGLEYRRQVLGPARGYWQFERAGVQGVATHVVTRDPFRAFLERLDYPRAAEPNTVQQWLEHNDVLAAGVARLNLRWVPSKLPAIGEVNASWNYYVSSWRPGKPHRDRWDGCYATAMDAVRALA